MSATGHNNPGVVVVMLRRPGSAADESRSDPYWEFGSFGTTGCHGRNLMNPGRVEWLLGKRLAFAQGGPAGIHLVHVTPPVMPRLIQNGERLEALWKPGAMPLRYHNSPCLVDNVGRSDAPLLLDFVRTVKRSTWVAKFSSAFRTKCRPVAGDIGIQLIQVYERWRRDFPEAIAQTYVDALPWNPPRIETPADRRRSYAVNTKGLSIDTSLDGRCKLPSGTRAKRAGC